MDENRLCKIILCLGGRADVEGLQNLMERLDIKTLQDLLRSKLGRSDCITYWHYVLLGFKFGGRELLRKRFVFVIAFLEELLKTELNYKQTYDLITRLCQDLKSFTNKQLVEICQYCIDSLRSGDPKCIGWKYLLPETIKVLSTVYEVNVDCVKMSGLAYRDVIVKDLKQISWPTEILTPIADMLRGLNLQTKDINIMLMKFSSAMNSLAPAELTTLCYQLFPICSASEIIIPLLSLERYFHRFYYKKLFANMSSNSTDFDSIDKYSDRELREAEETILHHLDYCTRYKITEQQMSAILRNFQAMPDHILTPFMINAIITMSNGNRQPNSRLCISVLLPFLRSVINNNEKDRQLAKDSLWCRDTLQHKEVDLIQIFTVLIEQNKEGKDITTPGLVNLAFVLLKTRNNKKLNLLANAFLIKFIRKRFIFGQGLVRKLTEWMITEQDQYQYSDCLTQLSVADTFTVSECIRPIKFVMNMFLLIPGEQAMRMMTFIFPLLKISAPIRDAFIEILRKAMKSSKLQTRRMAVFGLCMILKQLNNSNSRRSQFSNASSFCTQQTISGHFLLTQATLGNYPNTASRHFDSFTLEIISLLRTSFNQPVEIKNCLYENLQRAVDLNPKLTPHILQFIDWHFRSFFEDPYKEHDSTYSTDVEFSVKFENILKSIDNDQNQIVVYDNLGKLTYFVARCLVVFDCQDLDYDISKIKRLFQFSLEKIVSKTMNFGEKIGPLTTYKLQLYSQQIYFVEAIMAYALISSKQTNDYISYLGQLFTEHQKLEALKKNALKKPNKLKTNNKIYSENATVNITINGVVVNKFDSAEENIWDLEVILKFLQLLHENTVTFAAPNKTGPLRSNVELVCYIFQQTINKLIAMQLAPEYKQISHSKRNVNYLTDITKVIYERCIKRLLDLSNNFDENTAILAAECFQHCLQTANKLFKSFYSSFLEGFDTEAANQPAAIRIMHVIDQFMHEMAQNAGDAKKKERITVALLKCLECLLECDDIACNDSVATASYVWLLNFCKKYVIKAKLSLVFKLLFTQRLKTHSGAFFNYVALQFARVFGHIDESFVERTDAESTIWEAINLETAGFCFQHFYSAIHKQIEDVEYFIVKANNLLFKHRVAPVNDRDIDLASLRSVQRSICTQMVHITNVLLEMVNISAPIGPITNGTLKLLIEHYTCLKNLAKHFIGSVNQVPLKGSKFEMLLRVVGKPLPARYYIMIYYLEANMLAQNTDEELKQGNVKKKSTNPKADKAKIIRQGKIMSKVIFCIENFHKHVSVLSKRSSDRLTCFLHQGIVRDFRLNNSLIQEALLTTKIDSTQTESVAEENFNDQNGEDEEINKESTPLDKSTDKSKNEVDCDVNEDNEVYNANLDINSDSRGLSKLSSAKNGTSKISQVLTDAIPSQEKRNSADHVLKNLKIINEKTSRKRAWEIEQNSDLDMAAVKEPEPKKSVGRSRINR